MMGKEAYIQELQAKLDEWNAEIVQLRAKADKAEVEVRVEYQKQINDLHERRSEAKRKIECVRDAGEGAWQELKSGIQSVLKAMEKAIKSAQSRFK